MSVTCKTKPFNIEEHINYVRDVFETITYSSFSNIPSGLLRKKNGEYVSNSLEDHWQTFQEGWEYALKYTTNRTGE